MTTALTIERVEGRGLPMRGDDIDTDRIIPARFLKTVTFEGLERHVFEDERERSAVAGRPATTHPFDAPQYQGASVLLVNRNFGCGSSREHAPQALRGWGIRAVVGESFSEIFFGNSTAIGLACAAAAPDDVRALMTLVERDPATVLQVDIATGRLTAAEGVSYPLVIPANTRDALVTGAWDTTGLLLDRFEEVDATAGRLPYISGFVSPSPH